ncbi:hypothetical protein [Limosilactobacillus caecicola]|uniref:hypothetical protein n=1 Tax=Limosilactobacillus caecicola TaxID=2941332 RepID=UPI00203F5FCF|nr:hypothetical protein [Limosilactobacillus caecicola]
MSLIWLVVVALIIVIVIYEAVHRSLLRRATMIVRQRAQTVTDQIVLPVLDEHVGLDNCDRQSQLVSDIWGKGVLSFEYNINVTTANQALVQELSRHQLENEFNQRASQAQVSYYHEAAVPFRITDWWQGKKQFHLDVTYLTNEASFEYVHDLQKLQESSTEQKR